MALGKRSYAAMSQGKDVTISRVRFTPRKRQRTMVVPGYTRSGSTYRRTIATRARSLGDELKNYDRSAGLILAPQAGFMLFGSVNNVTQADGPNSRDGRRFICKALYATMVLNTAASGVAEVQADDDFRIVFYLDKQCNGVVATPTEIYSSPSITAHRNLSNSHRFRILYDRIHHLESKTVNPSSGLPNNMARVVKIRIPNLNIPVTMTGTTNSISNIRDNNIGVCIFSRTGSGLVSMNTRLRFVG
jgi:hypothetical protein